jgi:hypothetical protein
MAETWLGMIPEPQRTAEEEAFANYATPRRLQNTALGWPRLRNSFNFAAKDGVGTRALGIAPTVEIGRAVA